MNEEMNAEAEKLIVDNDEFYIQDCGGVGACLFKCLSETVSGTDHRTTRKQIVNYVIANWDEYSHWVNFVLHKQSMQEYRLLMGSSKSYGSEIECRAASNLYETNITVIRQIQNSFFKQTFNSDNNTLNHKHVYLLFTGMKNENDLDGHYQLLQKIEKTNENENSIPEKRRKKALVDITNKIDRTRTKKGKVFPQFFKETIVNVKNYFEEHKRINKISVIKETANCLQISPRSVYRVIKEYEDNGKICAESKMYNSGRKKTVVDDFYRGIIRKKIFDMYRKKEYPTVHIIHKQLLEDNDFPNISKHVLRSTLKEMNFKNKKLNKKPILMESFLISGQRDSYLTKINYYRKNEWNIFYTDETLCGANHAKKFGFVQDKTTKKSFEGYNYYHAGIQEVGGYSGGFVTPSGSEKRVIILHIGSKDGFLDGGLLCFIGNKSSTDYHNEMNAKHYEEWFRRVLPLLPDKSVIVIDQAPYHTMIDPEFRNPTSNWSKDEIIAWMLKRNIPLPSEVTSFQELTKNNLQYLCKPHHFEKRYLLDKIAQEMRQGQVKLLWLPVAHYELNPIELVWTFIKNQVASKNKTFKIKDVHNLCLEVFNSVPRDLWQKCEGHVIKLEHEYARSGLSLSEMEDSIIINTAEKDSEESEESEEESEESENEGDDLKHSNDIENM